MYTWLTHRYRDKNRPCNILTMQTWLTHRFRDKDRSCNILTIQTWLTHRTRDKNRPCNILTKIDKVNTQIQRQRQILCTVVNRSVPEIIEEFEKFIQG